MASGLTAIEEVDSQAQRGDAETDPDLEPATEDYLLSIALHGTAHHVETLVRYYRRAKEAEALCREARQQANRFVSYRYDDDGSLVLTASLPAEAGARVVKALNLIMADMPVAPVDRTQGAPDVSAGVAYTT